jgi:hypothetical protein
VLPRSATFHCTETIQSCAPCTGVALHVTSYLPAASTSLVATAHCTSAPDIRIESISSEMLALFALSRA